MGIEDMENMRNMNEGDKTRYEFNMGGTQAENPEDIKTFEEEGPELKNEIREKEEELRKIQEEITGYLERMGQLGSGRADVGGIGGMNVNVADEIRRKINEIREEADPVVIQHGITSGYLETLKERLSLLEEIRKDLLTLGPERNN